MNESECTCLMDGLCWYHQCECRDGRNPACYYHNELKRAGVGNSYDYAQWVRDGQVSS